MSDRPDKLIRIVRATAKYVLTILWVASGVAKLVGRENFETVLFNHGVLPMRAIDFAWIVPAVEVVLGATIFVAGSKPGLVTLRRLAGAASAMLLVAFCIYIARVPADIFKTVGCGCQGMFGLTDLTGSPTRGAAIGINCVFIVLSLCLWLGHRATPSQTPK